MPANAIVLRVLIHRWIIVADNIGCSTYHGLMPSFFSQLCSLGVLEFSGPDSRKFLQGQTTCDFEQLTPERHLPGAYCTPQGRMVCDFRAIQLEPEKIVLLMHKDLCDPAAAVFSKYIVFSRCELTDISESHAVLASWTEQAGSEAYEVVAAGDPYETRCEALRAAGAHSVPENDWQIRQLRSGIGHVEAATSELFLPQALNYQATGHINFSKGCYTGQEIVARMHYRGKVKRPMYLASMTGPDVPPAGDKILESGGKPIGEVVNAVADGEGILVLASLALGDEDAMPESTPGKTLEILELPYSLD